VKYLVINFHLLLSSWRYYCMGKALLENEPWAFQFSIFQIHHHFSSSLDFTTKPLFGLNKALEQLHCGTFT